MASQTLDRAQPRSRKPGASPLRVTDVVSALSFALDLTEGQHPGHSVRSCVIGMRIAEEIGLPDSQRSDLYYALLMKDTGCSTNASRMHQILGGDEISARRDIKTTDWTRLGWESLQYALAHVRPGGSFTDRVRALFETGRNRKRNTRELIQIRCERGASIARRIGLSDAAANAIRSLDELWDGRGQPNGLRGEQIPCLSRIMNFAQTMDVFFTAHGPATAIKIARARRGTWFDPNVVSGFLSVVKRGTLWSELAGADWAVLGLEPVHTFFTADETVLDNICVAFADVIDAKSPFTYRHSLGVAEAAVAVARTLSLNESEVKTIRRAALLHDIGKLGVPNSILDKPAKLTVEEFEVVKKHPAYSYEILNRIPGFDDLSEIAASHHEKLDGSGYFRGLEGDALSTPARILAVADVYDALAARRPYRDALPMEKVLSIMERETPRALDADCFEALKGSFARDLSQLAAAVSGSFSDALRDVSGGHPEPAQCGTFQISADPAVR